MERQRFVLITHVLPFMLLLTIGLCFGATTHYHNNDSLTLAAQRRNSNNGSMEQQLRYSSAGSRVYNADEPRSGGYPKFPTASGSFDMQQGSHLMRDTYYTARECGTRSVHFDPSQLLRKGKIIGGALVRFHLHRDNSCVV